MERFEIWMGKLWGIYSDMECVDFMLDNLERQFEYEGNEETRRCVRIFQIICSVFKKRINEIAKEMDKFLNLQTEI